MSWRRATGVELLRRGVVHRPEPVALLIPLLIPTKSLPSGSRVVVEVAVLHCKYNSKGDIPRAKKSTRIDKVILRSEGNIEKW